MNMVLDKKLTWNYVVNEFFARNGFLGFGKSEDKICFTDYKSDFFIYSPFNEKIGISNEQYQQYLGFID